MNNAIFNAGDILETIRMIQDECLDIRTTTMGISLLDCIDSDIHKACDKVYDKITRRAEKLVSTGEIIEKEYGIQVLDASIIDVHPDDKLKESIDNRVTALQQKQQAQVEQETAKVQAETALIKAQNEADIKVTAAKAEAEANQLKSASLTPELIQMTEAEARLKHGWVTVQGADATVVDANGK